MMLRLSVLTLAMLASSAALGEELTVEGSGLSRSVACNGKDVGIYGAGNTIALTGDCGAVIVHGHRHEVSFERAASLAISGAEHTIKGGETGALDVQSKGNTVSAIVDGGEQSAAIVVGGAEQDVTLSLASPASLDVSGFKHKVHWRTLDGAPEPDVQIRGVGSAVEHLR